MEVLEEIGSFERNGFGGPYQSNIVCSTIHISVHFNHENKLIKAIIYDNLKHNVVAVLFIKK